MQLESLILHLQEKLNEHRSNAQKPQACDLLQRGTYYLNLEADYTFRELERVIAQLKGSSGTYNGKTEITADHVNIIIAFLAKRWERIKSTDAIYSIAVTNSANLMCRELANYLSKQLRKLSGEKNENALLMPTVKNWRNPGHASSDMSVISPHRFQLTDDNLYCIELMHPAESLGSGGQLVLSHREHGNNYRELTSRPKDKKHGSEVYEFDRIYNHSKLVTEYYKKVEPMLRNVESNKKTIEAMKIQLRDALMRDDYIKYSNTITSTYGIQGEDLLKANLLKEIKNGLFADREQLFDYMAGKVLQSDWYEFLKKFGIEKPVGVDENSDEYKKFNDEFEKFRALICEKDTIKSLVRSKTMLNQHYQHDMAAALCKAVTYINIREPLGQYSSIGGWFAGDPLDAKRSAIEAIILGITENRHKGDWDSYASRHAAPVARAMGRGKVGYIFEQVKDIEARKQATDKASNKPARLGV